MEILVAKTRIAPVQILSHIRKNHAMEHATIHVLSELVPQGSFGGYSLVKGFWIMGRTELEIIQKAAEMAYARLNNGEKNLAVHPNCGTNFAVSGLCTAAAAMITTLAEDDDSSFSRFSAYTTAGMIGMLAGRKAGPWTQRKLTTDANVKDLSIVSINCSAVRGTPTFFVETHLE